MTKRLISEGERRTEVSEFLDLAFKDYLAARVLLNAHLVLQGAIHASMCIEKYLKAIVAIEQKPKKVHLRTTHFTAIREFDPALYSALNETFLLFLEKVYPLRYKDGVEIGFNIPIVDRPTLAELDRTAISIERCFSFIVNGQPVARRYHTAIEQQDERLFKNNYVLNNIDRKDFILEDNFHVYEIRNHPSHGLIEIEYEAFAEPEHGDFMRTALSTGERQPDEN